jgi:hypothetical protein
LWSQRPPLPELRLVLSQLLSVEPVLLACPVRLLLLPILLARHWLLQLPCLPLLQQPSLQRPSRPLCCLSSLHWLWPLQLPMLRPLLLQLPQCLQQERLRERLHWLQWLLRWRRWPLLSLQ